jgi:pilus assembly protein CpaC
MKRIRIGCGLALMLLMGIAFSPAFGQVAVDMTGGDAVHAGEFVVPVNKSQILKVDQPFTELLVGNPKIADVLALTNRTIYVLGKDLGATNLTVYGPNRKLIAILDLVVSYDVAGLKAKLHEVLPEEPIEVRTVNGGVLLSGNISNETSLSEALAIAEKFAPQAVTNALTVQGSQQVLLQVKFAEVSRTLVKQLGIGHDLLVTAGDFSFSVITSPALPIAGFAPFATSVLGINAGGFNLTTTFESLEQKGLVKTLAEPNLVALSGDTANFLAGGEFPVPVLQSGSSDAITVEYKEFGVGLAFTPTVIGKDLINLIVAPEVSRLDQQNSVTVNGTTVPGLATRRAKTTIELRDGQSFAIAGLLQDSYQDASSGLPWLGDVPILGLLFRSTGYQHNQTELVILVTPHLVKPASSPAEIALPTDRLALPSDADLFLFGRMEGQGSGVTPAAGTNSAAAPSGAALNRGQGGLSGQYGYILQ